jgi:hypothetical protein
MKVELAAPRVVDRTTFQAELDALSRAGESAQHGKATRLRPPAGGFQWSRLTAR